VGGGVGEALNNNGRFLSTEAEFYKMKGEKVNKG